MEAAGIEPASETIFTRASPGAVHGQHSLYCKPMNKLAASVASFVMHDSKLYRVTFTTVDALSQAVVLPGRTAA